MRQLKMLVWFFILINFFNLWSMSKPIKNELYQACSNGKLDKVKKIFQGKKIDINKGFEFCIFGGGQGKINLSPLYIAYVKNHQKIVSLLLEKGASIDNFFIQEYHTKGLKDPEIEKYIKKKYMHKKIQKQKEAKKFFFRTLSKTHKKKNYIDLIFTNLIMSKNK